MRHERDAGRADARGDGTGSVQSELETHDRRDVDDHIDEDAAGQAWGRRS